MEINKRAELHLHTKMSQMDAVISPTEAVKAAKYMGLAAVAITDHNGVQAFPEAMRASEFYGMKVIYGIEISYKERLDSDCEEYHQTILVRTQVGLKNLYRLVSKGHLEHCTVYSKEEIEAYREGLLFGSACGQGELFAALIANAPDETLESIVKYYDYLEIQPICSNRFYVERGLLGSDEDIKAINRRIVALGEKYNKPVVATCDAHFLDPEDEICRKILLNAMRCDENDLDRGLYLRTTEEMLEEFSYLGKEKAYEVVVKNTNKIADMIEEVRPIPKGTFYPHIEGAEDEIRNLCETRLEELYGEEVPQVARERLNDELSIILKNGYATLFMIAKRMVEKSESLGYHVGARGGVGASFVTYLLGITDIDPLKYDIPYETFFEFYGNREPDIALNFSSDIREKMFEFIEEMFGTECVFRAGTIGTLAERTAHGYMKKYFDKRGIPVSNDQVDRMIDKLVGVLRITGQHPCRITVIPKEYDVHDFTPIQHPADDQTATVVTTHFNFLDLYGSLLKIDVLMYDVPTRFKLLEELTGVKMSDVPLDDPKVLELFNKGETYGLPEFGTPFVRDILSVTKPQSFNDLLQISGLMHGTDTWNGNAEVLIKNGVCALSDVVALRDDIMLYLIKQGLDREAAFFIMEHVRKGMGLSEEHIEKMREHNVPDWYIDSCKKIKYLFPKAHAVAYVMSAVRLAWYKLYYPIEFYSSTLTVDSCGFEMSMVEGGRQDVKEKIRDIESKGDEATYREKSGLEVLYFIDECMSRGVGFLPVNLNKSDAERFLIENGAIRIPIISVSGIGPYTAQNIVKARAGGSFESFNDLKERANLTDEVIDYLQGIK